MTKEERIKKTVQAVYGGALPSEEPTPARPNQPEVQLAGDVNERTMLALKERMVDAPRREALQAKIKEVYSQR